jgi:hypothetical protein
VDLPVSAPEWRAQLRRLYKAAEDTWAEEIQEDLTDRSLVAGWIRDATEEELAAEGGAWRPTEEGLKVLEGEPDLTLDALVERAKAEGWHVQMTCNVHLDRPDWPDGTGAVLVESFDEDGLPAHWQRGTDNEGKVQVAGDKVQGAHDDTDFCVASTVEGVLEWAGFTWDSPDEPLDWPFGPGGEG